MGRSDFGLAHLGAVLVGAGYLVFGLVGFAVTGFEPFILDTPDSLLYQDLNPFHNVVHAAIGAYLLFAATQSRPVVEGALIGGGAVYLVAVFLGVTGGLEIISITNGDRFAAVNGFHLVSGSAALGLGLFSAATSKKAPDSSRVIKQPR